MNHYWTEYFIRSVKNQKNTKHWQLVNPIKLTYLWNTNYAISIRSQRRINLLN